jgi:serine O-acetyltransferase
MTRTSLIDAIRGDAERYAPGAESLAQLMSLSVRHRGLAATSLYRAARVSSARGNRFTAVFLSRLSHQLTHCTISSSAVIAPGLYLPHPDGVIIGAGAVIGPDCTIQQQVTIGGNFGRAVDGRQLPILEAQVAVAAGAVIAGPIRIGRDSIVGANTVVTKDVDPATVVAAALTRSRPRSGRFTESAIVDSQ